MLQLCLCMVDENSEKSELRIVQKVRVLKSVTGIYYFCTATTTTAATTTATTITAAATARLDLLSCRRLQKLPL